MPKSMPRALPAALNMGIPAVAIGTGYGIPPLGLKAFPVFMADHVECLYDGADALPGCGHSANGPTRATAPHLNERKLLDSETAELNDRYWGDI